jgi:hypothetical protein
MRNQTVRLSRFCSFPIAVLLLLLALATAGWSWHRWTYPYGWSHCCDDQLWFALQRYAADHGGFFPTGGATPEASLSLLYPKYADANLLRGKTVPEEVVQAILDRGEPLGPETCGWHYVEGLNLRGNPDAVLFWDKVGLGHNGQRLEDGGHFITRIGSGREYFSGANWPAFVEEQERLAAARQGKQ